MVCLSSWLVKFIVWTWILEYVLTLRFWFGWLYFGSQGIKTNLVICRYEDHFLVSIRLVLLLNNAASCAQQHYNIICYLPCNRNLKSIVTGYRDSTWKFGNIIASQEGGRRISSANISCVCLIWKTRWGMSVYRLLVQTTKAIRGKK